jgi:hypothetical protein
MTTMTKCPVTVKCHPKKTFRPKKGKLSTRYVTNKTAIRKLALELSITSFWRHWEDRPVAEKSRSLVMARFDVLWTVSSIFNCIEFYVDLKLTVGRPSTS